MPSVRRYETKDGRAYYLIRVRRGREKSALSRRWYVPDGWSQRAIDRELAKVSAEFERQVQAGEVISRNEKRLQAAQEAAEAAKIVTLRQYGEKVFMPAKTLTATENTRASFQGNLDKWVYPAIGDIKLPEITSAQISALLLDMQGKGKAHATVVKVYTILNSLFKMAYLSDMIARNPMDKVERPKPRKDEIKPQTAQAYTAQEVRDILTALEGEPLKWRAFIHLLIDTGVRRGEALAVQWEDIDFQENTILICRNLCYTPDKGIYLDTPKNGRCRMVDVGEDTLQLLKQIREQQGAGGKYIFTQDNSLEPMHPTSPTHYFRQFSKRNGIKDFHPHKLRHTFASVAITAGADVVSVSETLGHSDTAVTLRMYTHANDESRRRASRIFRDAIQKDTQKGTPPPEKDTHKADADYNSTQQENLDTLRAAMIIEDK